jgi:hypothetical protein
MTQPGMINQEKWMKEGLKVVSMDTGIEKFSGLKGSLLHTKIQCSESVTK